MMLLGGGPARWMVCCPQQYDYAGPRNVRRRARLTFRLLGSLAGTCESVLSINRLTRP
jgi:hypothetical protein